MSETKHNPVPRWLPSMADLAFLLPLVLLYGIRGGAKTVIEGDTGWHIRAGEWILANGRVPDKDFFSFTKPGEPWFAWEWGWDAIFAWLHQVGGMELVVLASMLVVCVTFVVVYRLAVRKSGNPLLAMAVTVIAIAGSSVHWWARPHMFTLLFTALFLTILDRVESGQRKLLWLLPALTVIWVNLHAGFLVGFILIGGYAGGHIVRAALAPDSGGRREALRRVPALLAAGAGCLAASFVNPYFYKLHVHILGYFSTSFHVTHISEFQSISFHNPIALYFEAALVMGLITAAWAFCRRRFEHALLTLAWAHLALFSARNIPLFLIIATPIVAQTLAEWLERLPRVNVAGWVHRVAATFDEITTDVKAMEGRGRFPLTGALAMAVVTAVSYSGLAPDHFAARYAEDNYPVKAVEELGATALTGRVFTDDEWSDYLIYELHPATTVFMDGRSDFYGDEFGNVFRSALGGKPSWDEKLSEYGVETVLLHVEASLAAALRESRNWRQVYEDKVAVVFQPAIGDATTGCEKGFALREESKNDLRVEVTARSKGKERL